MILRKPIVCVFCRWDVCGI